MPKNNNLQDYLQDLYEGIKSRKPDASKNPQNFRQEIENLARTDDADAIAADIRLGKTAYVDSEKITGIIPDYDGSVTGEVVKYTTLQSELPTFLGWEVVNIAAPEDTYSINGRELTINFNNSTTTTYQRAVVKLYVEYSNAAQGAKDRVNMLFKSGSGEDCYIMAKTIDDGLGLTLYSNSGNNITNEVTFTDPDAEYERVVLTLEVYPKSTGPSTLYGTLKFTWVPLAREV